MTEEWEETTGGSLAGTGILVTRPRPQAQSLVGLIRRAGGVPIEVPLLEILPSRNQRAARSLLRDSRGWDWVIFVSANAVRFAVTASGEADPWAGRARVAAVGEGTAKALADAGIRVSLVPRPRFDSESLLASPELHAVQGQRILIVRGEGGREILAQTLKQRGAEVEYAEVYRRAVPQIDSTDLVSRWEAGEVGGVVITSAEILGNLIGLLGTRAAFLLRDTPMAVMSARLETKARELGCRWVSSAPVQSDEGLLQGLIAALRERATARGISAPPPADGKAVPRAGPQCAAE